MAYQAKRSHRIIEDIDLVNDDGSVYKTLHIDLDACRMVERVSAAHINLVRVQQDAQALRQASADLDRIDEVYERMGHAVIDLYNLIFGEENTKDILAFYENHYVEMNVELTPFIADVVVPRIRKAAQESREKVMQGYNRKQRRKLFKGM